jgi:hypothetical protein
VANFWLAEQGFDRIGLVLAAAKMRRCGGGKFGRVGGVRLRNMVFDVVVEQFYGIELGAVAGQEVHLDLVNVFGQPVPYVDSAVDRVPVHDQVDLAIQVADEAVEKARNTGPVNVAV